MWAKGDAPRLASQRRYRFILSLTLLAVLWWFVLDALEREAARVEQVSFNMMINQLKSVLLVRSAEIMLDRQTDYEDVEGANPFNWMESQSSNYTGLCGREIPEGKWCFSVDLQNKTVKEQRGHLIYRTRQGIETEAGRVAGGKIMVWKVKAPSLAESPGAESSFDAGGGSGLKLQRGSADKQERASNHSP